MQNNILMNNTLSEDNNFNLKEVFNEAWILLKGSKLIFNISLIIYVFIGTVLQKLLSLYIHPQIFFNLHQYAKGMFADEAQTLLSLPILAPIIAGIVMLGVKRASLKQITIPSIFSYYTIVWHLVFASILVSISVLIGFMLFILPGIYLAVSFSFTTQLIIDKQLGVIEAMKTSLLAVNKKWFKFFGIYMSLIGLFMLSMLTLGIALIWLLPFIFIVNGILYKKVFGYSNPQNIQDDK